MAEEIDWKQHIGKRAILKERNGNQKLGTIRDAIHISASSGWQIDFNADGGKRARFYVPADMITLVPDELSTALQGDT